MTLNKFTFGNFWDIIFKKSGVYFGAAETGKIKQMPQDAFTIKYAADELNALLKGGKISKITQPEKDLLTFIIYTGKGSVKLEICLSAKGCRVNIAETELKAPQTAPGFCMLLRKHLQNAEIAFVNCVKDERIIYIDFDCTSEFELSRMRLYAELMGKYSNAVLVKDGTICGALKSTAIGESTKRVLLTGAKYVLPEPQDKISPEDLPGLEKLFDTLRNDAAEFISANVKGISYSTALDISETFNGKPTAKDVYSYICGGQISPCVTFSGGEATDFKVRSSSLEKKNFPSLLAAQTAYYAEVTAKRAFAEQKRKLDSALSSAIKKLEKRLAVIRQKLLDCKDCESVKLKGELITANIYAVERGADCLEAVNYYDENGGIIKIALDKTLSPAENAQKYYKRYAKLKRTIAAVSVQESETQQKLDYLYSINSLIETAENLSDLKETEEELKVSGLLKTDRTEKKKPEKVSPFRRFEKDGFTIISGRSNLQNDRILKSIAPNDLWLHTQNYHSSHVAVISEGREIPDNVIKTAAEICAYYSDGRQGNKIPVDYTRRAFVKKPPKSDAGKVIYTNYKTALIDPDGHAELKTE